MLTHPGIIYLTWSGLLWEFYFVFTQESYYAVSIYRRHQRISSFRRYFRRSLQIFIFSDTQCYWENLKNCSFPAQGKCCKTNLCFYYSVIKTLHCYGQYLIFLRHSTQSNSKGFILIFDLDCVMLQQYRIHILTQLLLHN